MAVTLDNKLVVAISSRALFNFEEENALFDSGDPRAYQMFDGLPESRRKGGY